MKSLDASETEILATYWMHLWADCLRARGGRALYAGRDIVLKDYRPQDDPEPMSFVFLQVEHCLGPRDGADWKLAKHIWLDKQPVDQFKHPDLTGVGRTHLFACRVKIIRRLSEQILEFNPGQILKEAMDEARTRLLNERRRPVRLN